MKIPGHAKKFQIKFGLVLVGVNAENKSWGKYYGIITIIYILIFPGNWRKTDLCMIGVCTMTHPKDIP